MRKKSLIINNFLLKYNKKKNLEINETLNKSKRNMSFPKINNN